MLLTKFKSKARIFLIVLMAFAVGSTTTVAYASANTTFYACRSATKRTLYNVVLSPSTPLACLTGDKAIKWNQIGPKGTKGDTGPMGPQGPAASNVGGLMWINHFDLLPGDSSVTTTYESTSSGVGGGLTGLVIESNTTGDTDLSNGNKVVHLGLQVSPGYSIDGVRVCYELSNSRSFITQISLAQIQDPPSFAFVMLDDATDQTNAGPVCVDSTPTSVDASLGAVLLSLRVNFADTVDKIVVRAVGLYLSPNP